MNRLASDLALAAPDTQVVPGDDSCGPASAQVVRGAFPEHVLFATASDQPAPGAGGVLDLLADRIRRDAPGAEVTVLGHTDSVGSDAYNIALSQRRALSVLRDLAARGLDPNRLSTVAIGKREPIADNDTAEGRARNRRVEFLISGCLAANLGVVRARPGADLNKPIDVLRMDPSAPAGLAIVGTVSLQPPSGEQPIPETVGPAARRRAAPGPVGVAQPAPTPHYQPKTLAPEAQPNPLGPAVPF